MPTLADIRASSSAKAIVEGQAQHVMLAILLTAGALSLLDPAAPVSAAWAKWSIALALIHQVIVAIVFRLQLHRNLMTRAFGENDMRVWAVIFIPLLVARPLTILAVGLTDATPIPGPPLLWAGLGALLLVPAIWALHSTLVHFTLRRALGGDHFRDDIIAMPMVDKGAFRYTSNAMYGVAFLGLWAIALLCNSWNALIVALFQHAYIWVHMYCTEAPDMRRIYTPA